MQDDEFSKLFKYMEELSKEMRDGFEVIASEFDQVRNVLDGVAEVVEHIDQEHSARDSQLNRVEDTVGDHEERLLRLEQNAA